MYIIRRVLDNFGERKLLVGRISLKKNDDNIADDSQQKVVPIYLNESSLKTINKTFMH